MIEVNLTGEVVIESTDGERNGQDGHATYSLSTTLRQAVEIDAAKEFHEGYVNLEGYVLSAYYTSADDLLHSFRVHEHSALGEYEVRRGSTADLSVRMDGSKDDWIQQAARYVTERPDMSVVDALKRFAGWDETDTDTLHRALDKVGDRSVPHVHDPVGGLSDAEYGAMMAALHNRCDRHDIGQFAPDGWAASEA